MAKVGGIAGDILKAIIEKIERLEDDKAAVAEDIRSVFAEAKFNGFDVKTIRQILKIRKLDENQRDEEETLLEVYKAALGMRPTLDENQDLAA